MENIKNLTLEELEVILQEWEVPSFRARQIFAWVYQKGALGFKEMSNLPLELREKLEANFSFLGLKVNKVLTSTDKTKKLLFELKDKNLVEAVAIPTQKRLTGCISSQAGCKFGCFFCASGALGFKRNLECAEMLEQIVYLKQYAQNHNLTHVVLMGTGEPLDNYDQVLKAIRIINSKHGLNIGARRITISTCGIIPGIERLAQEGLQVELSISLHAAEDKLRDKIMPVNKIYPLKALIAACHRYVRQTNRQITFEYILIKNLNSDLQSAKKLATILSGLNSKVNLIPVNPVKKLKIEPPVNKEIFAFRDTLLKNKIHVTLRRPRGADIDAACGQLRLKYGENI